MKTTLFFTLCVTLLLTVLPIPRCTAEKFRLTYIEGENPLNSSFWNPSMHTEKPFGLRTPETMGSDIGYYSIKMHNRDVFFIVDWSKSTQGIYIDTDVDGDLSDEKSAVTDTSAIEEGTGYTRIRVQAKDWKTPVSFSIECRTDPTDIICRGNSCYKGKVKFGDKEYTLALVDSNLDGCYNSYMKGIDYGQKCDFIGIDFEGDGGMYGFGNDLDVFQLCKVVKVDDAYYTIKPASDGGSITIEKIKPKMGILDVQNPDVNLILGSDNGPHNLEAPIGKLELPVGNYCAEHIRLRKKDDRGDEWGLPCYGFTAGNLQFFQIEKGKTIVVKAGTPLTVKMAAEVQDDSIKIIAFIYGQNGEEYDGELRKNNEVQPALGFKIIGRDGAVLQSSVFECG